MIDLGLDIYRTIGECADRLGLEAYAVGGVVRDFFLGRPCTDIDVVCCRVENGERRVEGWLPHSDALHSPLSTLHSPLSTLHSPPSIGIELARAVDEAVGGGKVSVFRNFGTASFKWNDYQIEFVGARRESYHRESRKPVVENGTLHDDQCRRDFTVNALAVRLNAERYGELVDPFGGIHDMDAGLLRTPLDPDITFSDDPLRMMRAVRFASQLGFRIDDPTFEAIGRNAERLKIVSAERIAVEMNKIMMSPRPSVGLKLMQKSGLMQLVLPEVAALQGVETIDGRGHKDIFYHTMEVVDNVCQVESGKWKVENDDTQTAAANSPLSTLHSPLSTLHSPLSTLHSPLYLRWAALLHDIGKPGVKRYEEKQGWTFHGHEAKGAHMVKRIFRRLRLPMGAEMHYVEKLVMLHMRPIVLSEDEVTDSAVRRLLFEAGDDIDDLMLLCNADITSKNPEKVRRHRANFELVKRKLVELEERDRIRNFQPPVNGEDIMSTFGIGPCHEIGIIKDAIKDAILDGKIPNEREAAWQMMLDIAKEIGLQPQS